MLFSIRRAERSTMFWTIRFIRASPLRAVVTLITLSMAPLLAKDRRREAGQALDGRAVMFRACNRHWLADPEAGAHTIGALLFFGPDSTQE